jgi:hypothetical protein
MRSTTFVLVALLTASSAVAQTTARTAHTSAWFGCWVPGEIQAPARDVRVCVVRTSSPGALRLITFAGDEQIREETIEADGAKHTIAEDRCSGERASRWSASGTRLFVSAELRCEGQALQPASTLSTLTTADRWVEIQAVGPKDREAVRTRRYSRSTDEPPPAVADLLRGVSRPSSLTMPRTTVDDVVEATKAVSLPVVELWLIETEPRLALNRQALIKLSGEGVSEPVIDLLVGLAYPKRFQVRRAVGGGGFGSGGFGGFDMPFASAMYGPWDYWLSPYAMMYSPFAIPWGYGPYAGWGGWGSYGWSGGYSPVVIGGSGEAVASGRGQVVNGQGYTRVESHRTASESGSSSDASSSGRSSGGGGDFGLSSSGGGSVSSGGYSSGGGGAGGGAVAVPR